MNINYVDYVLKYTDVDYTATRLNNLNIEISKAWNGMIDSLSKSRNGNPEIASKGYMAFLKNSIYYYCLKYRHSQATGASAKEDYLKEAQYFETRLAEVAN